MYLYWTDGEGITIADNNKYYDFPVNYQDFLKLQWWNDKGWDGKIWKWLRIKKYCHKNLTISTQNGIIDGVRKETK